MGLWDKLVKGLSKTRDNFAASVTSIFTGYTAISEDFYEELEEVLIMSDIGVDTTYDLLDKLKAVIKEKRISDPMEVQEIFINELKKMMDISKEDYKFEDEKSVVLIIGVNGVGKTTSIGKLAMRYKSAGKKVMLAAADTFRAAATEQLEVWANRADVPMILSKVGSDPASIIFDATASAKAKNIDILLCDTAGRLHNKKNLMEELGKINRIIDKNYSESFRETLLVLDATTGQNALAQAREFKEVADITGIILTKMDGTAKGGIAIAISHELGIPVKFIGVGEDILDLQKFNSNEFIDALFAK
ncbi:MAG: signal recognition particle-docking protein FtsY [Lachnospiraceae bacterium]|jgi:fused signal recognition particle receptor|nr:signal recognition particle-docking protein FtsY [Lachnospiraceae bacterium]